MKLKITKRDHFTPTRMAVNKRGKEWRIAGINKDVKKLESSYIAGGDVKRYSHCIKELSDSSNN